MVSSLERFADVLHDHPLLGRAVADVPTPAQLVDLDAFAANIAAMADFFRPLPARAAFSILSTIMSRPAPDKVITDAGVQSLANDYGTPRIKGHPELAFGYLSEEHGLFRVRGDCRTALDLGDRVDIHPGHCCSAANLHGVVFAVRGGVVEEVWRVTARGRSE